MAKLNIGKARPPGLAGYAPRRKHGDMADVLPSYPGIGQPSDYRPEYCQAITEFFTRDPWEVRETEKGAYQLLPKDKMPTAIRWVRLMKMSITTFHKWVRDYPEFAEAYAICQELQKAYILEAGGHTMQGNFAQFMLKVNHGMRDDIPPENDEDDDTDVDFVVEGKGQNDAG